MSEYEVYNLDVFDLCAKIPDNSIDFILTDPPFNLGKKDYDKISSDYWDWYREVLSCFERILKPNRSIVIETSLKYFVESCSELNRLFVWKQPIICYITNGISRRSYAGWSRYQSYLWFGKGETKPIKRYADLFPVSIKSSKKEFCFSNPKSVEFYEILVRMFTREGETVFDPFVGSGTSCLAAHSQKRKFIVGDCDERCCDLTQERLNKIKRITGE